jgi:predicted N-acetyltransferase YhbS
MDSRITLRRETTIDYAVVEHLTREAFWNVHFPGCDEHYLAHVLRESPDFIPELDWVAEWEGELVGNIMYAHSIVRSEEEAVTRVLTFGPLSVLPSFQNRGIGGQLIRHTLELAREMGHASVFIYGDPEYYVRFGFRPAEDYGIRTGDGFFSPALMACELVPGILQGITGRFHESPVYYINPEASVAFEASFPPKEKFETPSQKRFMELLSQSHE